MSYVKLRIRPKTTKFRIKFGQFLRRRLIVYIVCNQATGFTANVTVLECVNFDLRLQHLV